MSKIQIGAYEAKTRLPELLRAVQSGQGYTITNRGEAVADLIPTEAAKHQEAAEAVQQMRRFMMERKGRTLDIKALIDEGRS